MSKDAKKLAGRNDSRSRTPHSPQFLKYIGSGWAERDGKLPATDAVAPYAAKRRAAVAKAFKGKVVVIEAGGLQHRSNDTDYRYRAHSAFAHLTGWGSRTVPGSILVIDARKGSKTTLFFRETAGRRPMSFLLSLTSESFGLALART